MLSERHDKTLQFKEIQLLLLTIIIKTEHRTQKHLSHFHSTDCKGNKVLTFIITYEEKKMLWQQRVSRHFHNHRLTLWRNVVWKLTGEWDSSSGLEQYGKFATTFGFCTVKNAATRTNRTAIVSLTNVLHRRVKGDKILRKIKHYNCFLLQPVQSHGKLPTTPRKQSGNQMIPGKWINARGVAERDFPYRWSDGEQAGWICSEETWALYGPRVTSVPWLRLNSLLKVYGMLEFKT